MRQNRAVSQDEDAAMLFLPACFQPMSETVAQKRSSVEGFDSDVSTERHETRCLEACSHRAASADSDPVHRMAHWPGTPPCHSTRPALSVAVTEVRQHRASTPTCRPKRPTGVRRTAPPV
ncbi:hypothetical protein V5799_016081 [Amblyomma americanum]|uniref:Uncharacterized protein n=1 Tax=Amblyomma americanum TaxID=6943 RepID=A0AAQ4F647_AMBAM